MGDIDKMDHKGQMVQIYQMGQMCQIQMGHVVRFKWVIFVIWVR